jgi:hypothetical protein
LADLGTGLRHGFEELLQGSWHQTLAAMGFKQVAGE